MRPTIKILLLCICTFCFRCENNKENIDPLQEAIKGIPAQLKQKIDSTEYEIQIVYTQIERDAKGNPHLQSFYINRNDDHYFYPASTVKMPIAFLAMQRINELKETNPKINIYTTLEHGAGTAPQQGVSIDSSSNTGLPNVAHYVEQIFSVSDNDAYNRLYEFLGQDYINEELRDKGIFRKSRIRTRVGIGGFSTEANRFTNPVTLKDESGNVLYQQDELEAIYNQFPALENDIKGVGYYDDDLDTVINQAFDMSEKNFMNLTDLEASLQRIIFPELFQSKEQFNLTPEQYSFLYETMPKTPLDFEFHQSHADDYYDSYVKFFYNGDNKKPIPENIKIFNKVGWAYGTLTDCAYITDIENNIEFFLTATILVNKNGIFNDGKYEYEKIGLPFLSALGKSVYNYELKRPRHYKPDLTKYKQ